MSIAKLTTVIEHLSEDHAISASDRAEALDALREARDELKQDEIKLQQLNHRLQLLSHYLLVQQESERGELARRLHDEIGQSLTAAMINVQMLQMELPDSPVLPETLQALSVCLNDVRELSLGLRPSQLDDLGLRHAIDWYLSRESAREGFRYALDPHLFPARLPATLETSCFRILQDVVRGATKHGRLKSLEISSEYSPFFVIFCLQAEWINNPTPTGENDFLLGVHERATLVDGRSDAERSESQLQIRITLPLPQ